MKTTPLWRPQLARIVTRVTLHAALWFGVGSSLSIAEPIPLSSEPIGPGQLTSLVASSRSNRNDSALFAASYDPADWSGSVTGYRLNATSLQLDAVGLWGDQPARPERPHSTASLMDARDDGWPAARLVLSARTEGTLTTGISWEWAALSPAQQQALQTVGGVLDQSPDAEARAKDRMHHIRGDRSQEQSAIPPGPLRARASRQGDIVHAKLWLVGGQPSSAHAIENYAGFRTARSARSAMLYVGGNDGMLHGFDAATGQEKIAYLPAGLHDKLSALTQPNYRHAYYVDGSPLSGDLYLGTSGSRDANRWRTYLAGFLGAGGRGYFVLDISDPDTFNAAQAPALVVLDHTDASQMDRDIGHITADPVTEAGNPAISRQITRLNDDRWALVMGNGYNSADERAVLLIQYLDRDKELRKIVTEPAQEPGRSNGLAAPRLIDLDGDGKPDLAYAGDLHGNLWKFDLGNASPSQWKLAFDGEPLFVATDPSLAAKRQPITSAPIWKAHPAGGLMLAFGTGRELSVADRTDTQIQTVYGIRDDTAIGRVQGQGQGPIRNGRQQLVAQTLHSNDERGPGTLSSNPVPYTGNGARSGWFLDLPVARERVLQNPEWFEGDLIDVWSVVPATADGMGSNAMRRFRTTIDIINGAAPKSVLYLNAATNANGQASRIETSLSVSIRSEQQETGVSAPGLETPPVRQRLGKIIKRPSWRQMQ